jgi:hypothetical protein
MSVDRLESAANAENPGEFPDHYGCTGKGEGQKEIVAPELQMLLMAEKP